MAQGDAFFHEVFLHSGDAQLLAGTAAFIRDGVARGEPTMVVMSAPHIEGLRRRLDADHRHVTFADRDELGANPSRMLAVWRGFVDAHAGDGRLRGVGAPPLGRFTSPEVVEHERHEALLNVAFAGGRPWWLLCPYDVTGLEPDDLERTRRNHPFAWEQGAHQVCTSYVGPDATPDPFGAPLPEPPVTAVVDSLAFSYGKLRAVRELVADRAWQAGLDPARVADMVLAVDELATNSVRHATGVGSLRIWREPGRLVCEVCDDGYLRDPLVGRLSPDDAPASGRGLWMVNQICDLVQVRSSTAGTTIRVHARLVPGASPSR
jgi:anti-sigma regulatory factor (Ser/Thr protein kinase)